MSSKRQKRAVAKSSAKQKELKKSLSTVRGQLSRSEKKLTKARARAERWKREAKAQRRSASRAGARAETLQQTLGRASAAREPVRATESTGATASARPVAKAATADGVVVPDKTWSVVRLRAEARARGLVGLSTKPKAELLAALAGAGQGQHYGPSRRPAL